MLVNFILYSVLVFQSSDQTLFKETWEDGTARLEYEVQQEPGKDPVRHGDYKRWYQNGELEEKGKYRHGMKSGTWFFYYQNGNVKSSGKYNKDIQKGTWKFFYPTKQLKAEGEIVDGQRHGRWQEWLEDGTENPLLSGDYQFHRASYPSGKARAAGTLLDSIQQGKWGYWWEDGSRQIECEYLRGRMHGEWKFWHQDGTPDYEMLAGTYVNGRRLATSGDVEISTAEPQEKEWRSMDATASSAAETLIARGKSAVPDIIARMQQLDLKVPRFAKEGYLAHVILQRIFHGTVHLWSDGVSEQSVKNNQMVVRRWTSLWKLTKDDGFFWQVTLPANPRVSQAFLLEPPLPLNAAAKPPETFASRFEKRKNDEAQESIRAGLEWLRANQAKSGAWGSASFEHRENEVDRNLIADKGKSYYDVGVTSLALLAFMAEGNSMSEGFDRDVVRSGIFWLLQQQGPAGLFDRGIAPIGKSEKGGGDWKVYHCQTCGGLGAKACSICNEVGRLANGASCDNCLLDSPSCGHCTGTGLIWKRVAVAKDDSVFIETQAVKFTSRVNDLYNQTLATMALCEALSTSSDPRLRSGAEKAIQVLIKAQNPYSAWGTSLEPDGKNHTAISAWIGCTLVTARNVGIEIPDSHFAGTLDWLKTMTDHKTGRTGFSLGDGGGPGGRSMRISGTHERYPVEKGEALTAGSLWYKLYSENFPKVKKDHADYEIWTRQASLVFSTPPLWDDEGGSIDLFYWYFGSLAMNAWGGSAWKGW
ncbi:MAG: hypothetical protein H8E15_08085, partial [Planctomycetes bacterium]|nr:hypothetical protein [Planctomycetota bacterium]